MSDRLDDFARLFPEEPEDDNVPSAEGDPELIHRMQEHVDRNFGPLERVFHETFSPYVHIDVLWVPPTRDREFHTLVSRGMSARPMNAPAGYEHARFAELMIYLPPEWPMSVEAFRDERHYWPIRWLRDLARFPHECETWLQLYHTVPNGDPPHPLGPGTDLCCMLVLPAFLEPEDEATHLDLGGGREVEILSLAPIYREEMEYKLEYGTEALLDRFEERGILPSDVLIIDPRRRNAFA